jgi:hypothetical protein
MSETDRAETALGSIKWFLGVPLRAQTYRNLLYLACAFPLGLAYFVFLTVGFSVGVSMAVLLVGIPLLLAVVFVATQIAAVERTLAEVLLDVEIPADEADPDDGAVDWLKGLVLNLGTWKGIVYLFSKFVLGLVAFVALACGLTFAWTLMLLPLRPDHEQPDLYLGRTVHVEIPDVVYQHEGWTIGLSMPFEATLQAGQAIAPLVGSTAGTLLVSAMGVLVALVALHLFNALAWVYARYTELMLRRTRPSVLTEWRARKAAGRDE